MTKSLERLKIDLKRINKVKADLEREIAEREFDLNRVYIESRGFSFDKIYMVSHEWVNWCQQNNIPTNILYTNFYYRIDGLSDNFGVRAKDINDNGYNLYVPFEFLIEVDEDNP